MMLASLVFSAPVVLVACLAAGIPVLLHLLGRATARTLEFPALRFIRTAAVKTARRRHLENVLLLLFRVGLFTLLPLALALPFYRPQANQFGAGRNLALAVVLDNTASMNQRVRGQPAFELAKQQAVRLLRGTPGLSPPETAILVCPLNQPPVVTSNLTQLAEQIRTLAVTGAETDLVSALYKAQELLNNQPAPNKLIYVLTDRQKTSFRPDELAGFKAPIAVLGFHETDDNLGISDVQVTGPIIAGKPIGVRVQVGGKLSGPGNLAVKMFTDSGQLLHTHDILYTNQPLEPIAFDIIVSKPGPFSGRVDLAVADQSTIDNRWYLSFDVSPSIPAVVCIPANTGKNWPEDPAFFVTAALNAPGWVNVRSVPARGLSSENLKPIHAIFLPRCDDLNPSVLKQFLNGNHKAAVIFSSLDGSNPLVAGMGFGEAGSMVNVDTPAIVEQTDGADPLMLALGFKNSVYRSIAVSRYVKIVPAEGSEPLLTLSTGDPLLLKRRLGDSVIYLFTSPPQLAYGTLPVSAPFPAILSQIAADTVPTAAASTFCAGKPFTVKADRPARVVAPASQPVMDLKAGLNQVTYYAPGFYQLRDNTSQPQRTLAVNCSPQAIDLSAWSVANAPDHSQYPVFVADTPEALESYLTQLAQGQPLWDYILMAVLMVLLAETLLANLRKPVDFEG